MRIRNYALLVFPCSTLSFGSSVFARPDRLSQQLVPLPAAEMRVLLVPKDGCPTASFVMKATLLAFVFLDAPLKRNEDAIGLMANAHGCFVGLKMPFGNENSIVFKFQSCLMPKASADRSSCQWAAI